MQDYFLKNGIWEITGELAESVIKDRIAKYIEEQALLKQNQHGFLSNLLD